MSTWGYSPQFGYSPQDYKKFTAGGPSQQLYGRDLPNTNRANWDSPITGWTGTYRNDKDWDGGISGGNPDNTWWQPQFGAAQPSQPQQPSQQPATLPQAQPQAGGETPWWQTSDANNYRGALTQGYRDIQNELKGLAPSSNWNYWDIGQVRQGHDLYSRLADQMQKIDRSREQDAFSGDYAGQALDWNALQQQIDGYGTHLGGLWDQYDAEASRVRGMNDWLKQFANDYYGLAQSSTVHDGGNLDSYLQEIDNLQRVRSLDNTRLYDIFAEGNPYANDIQSTEDRLRSLVSEYGSEQSRIKSEQAALQGLVDRVTRDSTNAGYYSGGNLSNLEDTIGQVRQRISGFDSPLAQAPPGQEDWESPFAAILSSLGGLDTSIAGLRGSRETALQELIAKAAGYGDTARNADLWDEGAIKTARDGIYNTRNDFLKFTGSDLEDENARLDEILAGVTGRMDELGTKRSGFESQAQDFLSQLRGRQFRYTDELGDPQSQYDALFADAGKYGASQANDELSAIMSLLTSNRQRLENEQRQREARDSGGGRAIVQQDPMQQMSPYLGARPEDDVRQFNQSALLRALGLA